MYQSPQTNTGAFPQQNTYRYSNAERHELPATPGDPRSTWQSQNSHRLSELPSESTQRSEMESPVSSPRAFGTPHFPGNRGVLQPEWTASASRGQQDQALGISTQDRIETWRDQPEFRGYHGA
jgi:hypothetical protein